MNDEKVEMDSRDGCTTLRMDLLPLNYIVYDVKMVNFILCTNKIKGFLKSSREREKKDY